MNEVLQGSAYFGFFLALGTYWIGLKLQKRFPCTLCNPLLISTVLCIALLLVFRIDYEVFDEGASRIS